MKKTIVSGLLAILAVFAILLVPQPGHLTQAADAPAPLTLDVSCDGRTFAANRENSSSSKIMRGDLYVLNGTIYKGGTIPEGGTKAAPSSFGPESAGSIGQWYCRGAFLVDAAKFNEEKLQRITTHYFALQGKDRLITEGFEGSVETNRVILGGIQSYAGARGISTMQRLGINATGAYNLRFTFQLQ